jgi:hypothetical protein
MSSTQFTQSALMRGVTGFPIKNIYPLVVAAKSIKLELGMC